VRSVLHQQYSMGLWSPLAISNKTARVVPKARSQSHLQCAVSYLHCLTSLPIPGIPDDPAISEMLCCANLCLVDAGEEQKLWSTVPLKPTGHEHWHAPGSDDPTGPAPRVTGRPVVVLGSEKSHGSRRAPVHATRSWVTAAHPWCARVPPLILVVKLSQRDSCS
jgi:hypothetical protein